MHEGFAIREKRARATTVVDAQAPGHEQFFCVKLQRVCRHERPQPDRNSRAGRSRRLLAGRQHDDGQGQQGPHGEKPHGSARAPGCARRERPRSIEAEGHERRHDGIGLGQDGGDETRRRRDQVPSCPPTGRRRLRAAEPHRERHEHEPRRHEAPLLGNPGHAFDLQRMHGKQRGTGTHGDGRRAPHRPQQPADEQCICGMNHHAHRMEHCCRRRLMRCRIDDKPAHHTLEREHHISHRDEKPLVGSDPEPRESGKRERAERRIRGDVDRIVPVHEIKHDGRSEYRCHECDEAQGPGAVPPPCAQKRHHACGLWRLPGTAHGACSGRCVSAGTSLGRRRSATGPGSRRRIAIRLTPLR